ncbi:hypothetical protein AB0D10_41990 [Kitasatospora sp. NPDC048545]|uniref:hypothetical protein n=1 Tax=Kitasatospora sp. NPDC048545 TaxID=3157208 RepID=UPI00340672DE
MDLLRPVTVDLLGRETADVLRPLRPVARGCVGAGAGVPGGLWCAPVPARV